MLIHPYKLFFTLPLMLCFYTIPVTASEYKFTRALSSPITETLSFETDVTPRQTSEVQAPRDGIIKQVFARTGDQVAAGTVLAQLDDRDLREQHASLQKQRNEFTGHMRRVEKLVAQGHISDEIWDKNMQRLAQIRAELAIIDEKLKHTMIKTPVSGTVLWMDVEDGAEVKGASPVYWVGDQRNLWLTTPVKSPEMNNFAKDDIVAVYLDDADTAPIQGVIDFVGLEGPSQGTKNVYINVPLQTNISLSKSYRVLVPIASDKEFIIVPDTALDAEGYIYELGPIAIEPDKYMLQKKKAAVTAREAGIVKITNVPQQTLVLLNPDETNKHGQIVTAYEAEDGQSWSAAYAAAILKNEFQSRTGCGGGGEGAPATGGCGGGCGAAGAPVEAGLEGNSELMICNVPSELFEEPKLEVTAIPTETEAQMPLIPEELPQTIPSAQN